MSALPDRMRRGLPALLGLGIFLVALEVLRRELQTLTWDALSADVRDTPPSLLATALALTALNYAVLTGYDLIAFAYVENPLSRWRVAGSRSASASSMYAESTARPAGAGGQKDDVEGRQ